MVSTSMQPLAIVGLGLLLGLRHAADPDHVVAIGAIAARTQRLWPAMRLGIVWGLGHTLTLFVVASGIILFDWVVPPRLGLAMEMCVGVALVIVGLINVRTHSHRRSDAVDASGPRRAFFVGLVHGLAGSAAVALLVVSTVRDPRWACAYILVFGAGTLAGMTLITTGLALPLSTAAQRWHRVDHVVRLATGAISVTMGVWLVYQIGWSDGLFRAVPTWTPH
jgi:high-affinity nickel-transport protein